MHSTRSIVFLSTVRSRHVSIANIRVFEAKITRLSMSLISLDRADPTAVGSICSDSVHAAAKTRPISIAFIVASQLVTIFLAMIGCPYQQ
jgi:hypothetical protein